MPLSSLEIRNRQHQLHDSIDRLTESFNAAEGDAKDALRDQISSANGELKALDSILDDVLSEEDKVRRGGGIPLASASDPAPRPAFVPMTLADRALGDPRDFKGLSVGDTVNVDVSNDYTKFGLVEHKDTDYTLTPQHNPNYPEFGVYSTLARSTTKADSFTYFEADPQKYVNKAAVWTPGTLKPTSSMAWTQRSCHTELIANGMPVLETNLKDYGQLRSMIDTELFYMQEQVKAARVLKAPKENAETGMAGILTNDRILTKAKASSDTIEDTAFKMVTDVFLATGFHPTTLGMHPYVEESIALSKDKNGRYMQLMVDGKLWALRVVDDVNLMTDAASGETSTPAKYGMLVYLPTAATFFTQEGEHVDVGTINDQFMRNELTIRIEGRYGLKVTYPKAFCYCADTGISGR